MSKDSIFNHYKETITKKQETQIEYLEKNGIIFSGEDKKQIQKRLDNHLRDIYNFYLK